MQSALLSSPRMFGLFSIFYFSTLFAVFFDLEIIERLLIFACIAA